MDFFSLYLKTFILIKYVQYSLVLFVFNLNNVINYLLLIKIVVREIYQLVYFEYSEEREQIYQ